MTDALSRNLDARVLGGNQLDVGDQFDGQGDDRFELDLIAVPDFSIP